MSLLLTPAVAAASTDCGVVITARATRHIFERLRRLEEPGGCRLTGVFAQKVRLELRWRLRGQALSPAVLVPAACAPAEARADAPYAISRTEDLARLCPAALRALRRVLRESPAQPSRPSGIRKASNSSFSVALGLMIALLALLIALGVRAILRLFSRCRRFRSPWMWLATGGLVLALVLRLAVEPALSNWYAEVLPLSGVPEWMRFGPGAFAFHAVLRIALPWTDSTLFLANTVLGAVAVPVFVAILRERAVPLTAAALVALLFALAPMHVRNSASASEMVLSSTLTLVLLLAWLRARRTGDVAWLGLALLLVPIVALTRPDAWPPLAVVPLWALWRDAPERTEVPPRSRRRELVAAVGYWILWAGVGAVTYFVVVVPSKHPGPDAGEVLFALRNVLWQYVEAGFTWPHWFSPAAVLLAIPGAIYLAWRRPALFAGLAALLVAAFVPVGRTLQHDGLVGSRYFLTTIPVFLVASGFALTAAAAGLRWLRKRLRPTASPLRRPLTAWGAGMTIAAVGTVTLLLALDAYRCRYAFQDEYRFLSRVLTRLPDGCTVWQLPVRDQSFGRDLDCCLDVARSPLTIAFPNLRFRTLALRQPLPRGEACAAYYSGPACALDATSSDTLARHARTYRALRERCRVAEQRGVVVATGRVSPRATNDLFAGKAPPVRLLRWLPPVQRRSSRPAPRRRGPATPKPNALPAGP